MGKSKKSVLDSFLKVMLISAVAMVILIAIFIIGLRLYIKGRIVEVPNIVGKSFLEASQILSKSHLRTPIIEGEKYTANMPEGYIVEQKPKPGSRVKTGREIKVFISKGTEAGVVPDVTGETVEDAQPVLKSLGLEMGAIVKVHSDDYPKEGIIIAHSPPPMAKVQKGIKVNLLVSLGKPYIQMTMPDLSGMYLEDALDLIRIRGLRPGLIEKEISPDVNESGVILDQYPQANDHIKKGITVNLVISSTEYE